MRTCTVAHARAHAFIAFAVTQNAEVVALEAAQWDALNHGCGEGAEQEQHKGHQEDDGQGSRRP